MQEFIALAKSAPDKIHYASSGNGSAQNLMGGLFVALPARRSSTCLRGSAGAATDLVAGVSKQFRRRTNAWRNAHGRPEGAP